MKSRFSDDCALLLIDIQNDFVDGGALAVPGGLEVIQVADALMPLFGLVVATQDWHPADHQSFASQHPGLAIGDSFQLAGLAQIAWPDHCVQDSHGAEFVATLNLSQIRRVVRKGTDRSIDSYSGFFDNGRKKSTGLADYLHQQNVRGVYVMGLATDYCVRATVLDALQAGLKTFLILDGCRGVDLHPGDIERAVQEMAAAGAHLVNSKKILEE